MRPRGAERIDADASEVRDYLLRECDFHLLHLILRQSRATHAYLKGRRSASYVQRQPHGRDEDSIIAHAGNRIFFDTSHLCFGIIESIYGRKLSHLSEDGQQNMSAGGYTCAGLLPLTHTNANRFARLHGNSEYCADLLLRE